MNAPSVTELLHRVRSGEHGAHEALVTRVHGELARIARAHLARSSLADSLQPTELLHEAYLRLVAVEDPSFECRQQFFGLVSCIMRSLLADMARRRGREKHGGDRAHVALDLDSLPSSPSSSNGAVTVDLLDLSSALDSLARIDPILTQVAELRYLAGFDVQEISDTLTIPVRTIERRLAAATAWLRDQLRDDPA